MIKMPWHMSPLVGPAAIDTSIYIYLLIVPRGFIFILLSIIVARGVVAAGKSAPALRCVGKHLQNDRALGLFGKQIIPPANALVGWVLFPTYHVHNDSQEYTAA